MGLDLDVGDTTPELTLVSLSDHAGPRREGEEGQGGGLLSGTWR